MPCVVLSYFHVLPLSRSFALYITCQTTSDDKHQPRHTMRETHGKNNGWLNSFSSTFATTTSKKKNATTTDGVPAHAPCTQPTRRPLDKRTRSGYTPPPRHRGLHLQHPPIPRRALRPNPAVLWLWAGQSRILGQVGACASRNMKWRSSHGRAERKRQLRKYRYTADERQKKSSNKRRQIGYASRRQQQRP